MAQEKTEEGLKALSGLRAKLAIGWDALVIDAVCAHYGLDRATLALPPKTKKDAKPKDKAGAANDSGKAAEGKADGAAEPEVAGK